MPTTLAYHWRATVLQRSLVSAWSRGAWLTAIREELGAAGMPTAEAVQAVGICADVGNEGPSGYLLGAGFHATFHLWSDATPRVCELDLFTKRYIPPHCLRAATEQLMSAGDRYLEQSVARGTPIHGSGISSREALQRATPVHAVSSHLVVSHRLLHARTPSSGVSIRDRALLLIRDTIAAVGLQPLLPAAWASAGDDPYACSVLQVIKTSHIAVHVSVENQIGHIHFDLFSCKPFSRDAVEGLVTSFVHDIRGACTNS